MVIESCKTCARYNKKERRCSVVWGLKQGWEWCTRYVLATK